MYPGECETERTGEELESNKSIDCLVMELV